MNKRLLSLALRLLILAALCAGGWFAWGHWQKARVKPLEDRYQIDLRGEPFTVAPGNTHVYAQYTIRVQDRDGLGAELRKRGVPTAIYYPKCLHEQPVFADCGHQPGDFPEAMRAAREVISLPMHPFLEEAQQDQVIAAVREALSTGRV
jgi:dTDP-4-amino-4,6-dideoxygalactose transaminase